MRARTVGELAAQHGVPLEDLVRTPLFGMLAPDAPFFCTFRWDMHHEHPVTTAEDLAGRELLSYDGWSIDDDKPKVGLDAVGLVAARRLAGVQPAGARARARGAAGRERAGRARTVGVHMDSWEVDLGTHVATLEGARPGSGTRCRRRWAHAWSPTTACASSARTSPARASASRSRPGSGVGEKRPSASR